MLRIRLLAIFLLAPSINFAGTLMLTSSDEESTWKKFVLSDLPPNIYDDFSGAVGTLADRMPKIGQHGWIANGAGYLNTHAGNGMLGSTGGNTYYIIQNNKMIREVTAVFTDSVDIPYAVISLVNDYPAKQFSIMFHSTFGGGNGASLTGTYWDNIDNGGAANVIAAPVEFQLRSKDIILVPGENYLARIVLCPPYALSSISTVKGELLQHAVFYEPQLARLIGTYSYIQTQTNTQRYTSFSVRGESPEAEKKCQDLKGKLNTLKCCHAN